MCIDLDRILHWINSYCEELRKCIQKITDYEFLLFGRTKRAFETHPITQVKTERIANKIASYVLKFDETRDIISACWSFEPSLAKKIIDLSSVNPVGFYCRWPIEAWKMGKNTDYREVEGLEWETPERFESEIEKFGYDAWLEKFTSSEEWEKRVNLLNGVVDSLFENYL
ncbi:hypothetical protein AKJ57_00430 [candidate division MSBL1 archaeon SCGC-AAA259A05]|uniref:Uncharacterized protein n=1 Tax=candidate division MSBL1 archaeon SCGC-AAA259A05 TaxID=1698259 RepID=A0A133UBS2_9EURY|nr:hypothetical protein AKJ57_00430 [candidate division MSBL1 archaeon SCGC-AAA259A05]